MVNGMVLREGEETDRGHLEHAAKIDGLGQLLAAQVFNLFDIGIKRLIKPGRNLGGVVDRIRAIDGSEIKRSGADAAEEALFRGHNVPRQFQRAFGDGIGAIVAFLERNGLDDPLGGFMFCFDGGQGKR